MLVNCLNYNMKKNDNYKYRLSLSDLPWKANWNVQTTGWLFQRTRRFIYRQWGVVLRWLLRRVVFVRNSYGELQCQPVVTGDGIRDDLFAGENNRVARRTFRFSLGEITLRFAANLVSIFKWIIIYHFKIRHLLKCDKNFFRSNY